jgi:hypothetical protein
MNSKEEKSLNVTTSISIPNAACVFKKVRSYLKSYWGVQTLGACCDVDKAIGFVFASDGGFLRPLQRPVEIRALLSILSERKPAVIVEIGTASGGNLFLFTRVAANNALVVSIDLPAGGFGGGTHAGVSRFTGLLHVRIRLSISSEVIPTRRKPSQSYLLF